MAATPCWVPPLRGDERKFLSPRRNPFLVNNRVELFLCCRGGEVVGLIAAVLNRDHQRQHRDRCGFFGLFECVNDPQAAALLLQAAAAWLKDLGCDTLRGPMSFSLNGVAGLLVDGFDRPPAVMMAYNPPYYRDLLAPLGFRPVMRFFTYEVSNRSIRFPGAVDKLEQTLTAASASAPWISPMRRDMAIVIDLDRPWADNWGFVPATLARGMDDFRKMRQVAREDLIIFAEEALRVGFSLSLPDVNQALRPLNGRLFPCNWLRLLRNLKKIDRNLASPLMGVGQGIPQPGHRPGVVRTGRTPSAAWPDGNVLDPGKQRADEPRPASHQCPR